MSANEEQNIECPLCMEPLEMDDINFFPCTCGYQICRFCWHRIRTDENGLCPACRKQYPEDPADFKPLSQEELQKIKNDKKQKDLQRKHKISENRKHLANVRVVQKNLVFVVGLSQRLADPEVLKKHEYFGKFGKIHKVVINHSTSYAGSQGPSASAYVTYNRAEDALRAIQAVNNIYVDGRTLKASLGTTKYCSHFLKNQQCPKPDCMYLHELGDEAASFTKEEMQQGKHQEYEKKLHEQLFNSVQNHLDKNKEQIRKQASSPTILSQQTQLQLQPSQQQQSNQHSLVQPLSTCSKEAWPSLNSGSNCKSDRPTSGNKTSQNGHRTIVDTQGGTSNSRGSGGNNSIGNTDHVRHRNSSAEEQFKNCKIQENTPSESQTVSGQQVSQYNSQTPTPPIPTTILQPHSPPRSQSHAPPSPPVQSQVNRTKSPFENIESHSLFSSTSGFPNHSAKISVPINNSTDWLVNTIDQTPLITADTIQVSSTTDWQAAFGFGSSQRQQDDDLGFDPWNESSKALADLIEKESGVNSYKTQHHHHHHHHHQQLPHHTQSQHSEHNSLFTGVHLRSPPLDRSGTDQQKRHSVPPGFSINNHFTSVYSMNTRQPYTNHDLSSSKLSFLNLSQPSTGSSLPTYHDVLSDIGLTNHVRENHSLNSRNKDVFNAKDWQEGLRALLPNINISFGSSTNLQSNSQGTSKDWSSLPQDRSWLTQDPAIVTGQITDSSNLSDSSTPHWMKSLQQLTEIEPFHYNGRTVPFATQYTYRAPPWPASMQSPPPGFSAQVTSTEPQKIQNL